MSTLNGIADMETYTTWTLICVSAAILAICGGILDSWALIIASAACLLICIAKVLKFYTPLHGLPIGG